ncbi:hypothetical protein D9M69_579700 [compost metagenome]
MMTEILSPAPTDLELADVPTLTRWRVMEHGKTEFVLTGLVRGHPNLDDGKIIVTSPVIRMDLADYPAWAESSNRYYRLGYRMGPSENCIWDLMEKHKVAVWKTGHPSFIEQFRQLVGEGVRKVGHIECSILLMISRGILTTEQARALYFDFCDETGHDPFAGGADDA